MTGRLRSSSASSCVAILASRAGCWLSDREMYRLLRCHRVGLGWQSWIRSSWECAKRLEWLGNILECVVWLFIHREDAYRKGGAYLQIQDDVGKVDSISRFLRLFPPLIFSESECSWEAEGPRDMRISFRLCSKWSKLSPLRYHHFHRRTSNHCLLGNSEWDWKLIKSYKFIDLLLLRV